MEHLIPCILWDLSFNLSKMAAKFLESHSSSHTECTDALGWSHIPLLFVRMECITSSSRIPLLFVRKECITSPESVCMGG